MPNSIKHSDSAQTDALGVGDMHIGVGGKGPTSSTGFYTGINPPSGGYTVYYNKASGGPSITTKANDAALIAEANGVSGESMSTIAEVLVYYAGQSDKMVMHNPINGLVINNLSSFYAPGAVSSYPRSGTTLYDLSGNAKNGTLTNSPTFNSNGYMDLDGVDDFISIDTYTFGNGNWTVSMVVNADNITVSNLLSNTSGGPVTNAFGFASSKIHYRNYDGAWQTHNGNTTLSTGRWYNLTWVNYAGDQASTGTMKMYVDGVADSSEFNSYATNGGPCNAIGSNWFSKFNGRIANTKFYTKSLTDAEILQNYYKGSLVTDNLVFAADAGNLVSYENSETTTYSLTGSYDATLTNGVDFVNSNGGFWDFDGVDDYIEIPYDSYWNTNVFGEAKNFTIMCWTKCDNFYNWSSMIHKDNGSGWYSSTEGAALWANAGGFQAVFGSGNSGNPSGWGFVISYATSNTTDWFHLAFTGDGTTGRFYVNGVEETTAALSSRSATVNTSTNPVRFGVRAGSANYNGKITQPLLYDRGLTAAEVQQNYNATVNKFN